MSYIYVHTKKYEESRRSLYSSTIAHVQGLTIRDVRRPEASDMSVTRCRSESVCLEIAVKALAAAARATLAMWMAATAALTAEARRALIATATNAVSWKWTREKPLFL